ncbi:unnamed protein product [Ectocarpus sp. 8 AP-2014]
MNAAAGDGLEAGSLPPFHTEGEHDHHHRYPGSEAMRKMTVNKISTLQALTISGLELALTLGNAVKKEAFQFSSGSDLIFGGSALIEVVGFLFAIWMALIALFRPPSADNAVGSGIPVMVLWEGISTGSTEIISTALHRGIWAQTVVFLVTLIACWSASPGTRPDWAFENSTGQAVGLVLILSWVAFCALAIWTVRGGLNIVILLHLGIIPLGVEVFESVLLFTSDSSTFITYVLAVLNLVIVAPALVLVPVYFRFLRDEERRRHAPL